MNRFNFRILFTFLLGIGISFLGCTGQSEHRTGTYESENDIRKNEQIDRIFSGLRHKVNFSGQPPLKMHLEDRLVHYKVPGISIAYIDSFKVSWVRSFGVKDTETGASVSDETLFSVKSMSKPIAATMAMRLIENGQVQLDEPLENYLKSWNIPVNSFTEQRKPTLTHLLSHSAGFTRWGVDSYQPDEPLPTLLQSIKGEPPTTHEAVTINFVPGSFWRYSGGGYGVLQQLMEDVTGIQFIKLADSLIFKPLQMDQSFFLQKMSGELTGFVASGHDIEGKTVPGKHEILPIMAAGGLWSTTREYSKYLISLMESYNGVSGSILTEHSTGLMMKRVAADWGLGVKIDYPDSTLQISHGGSGDGFNSQMIGFPAIGNGIIVLTNSDAGRELINELILSVAIEYNWPNYELVERTLIEGEPGLYSEFTGKYRWSNGMFTEISVSGDTLYARFDEDRPDALFPLSNNKFVTYTNEIYEFKSDSVWGDILVNTVDDGESFEAVKLGPENLISPDKPIGYRCPPCPITPHNDTLYAEPGICHVCSMDLHAVYK